MVSAVGLPSGWSVWWPLSEKIRCCVVFGGSGISCWSGCTLCLLGLVGLVVAGCWLRPWAGLPSGGEFGLVFRRRGRNSMTSGRFALLARAVSGLLGVVWGTNWRFGRGCTMGRVVFAENDHGGSAERAVSGAAVIHDGIQEERGRAVSAKALVSAPG